MAYTARSLIDTLGGYRTVAERLGKRATTVHTHMMAGEFPAAWFAALCDLCKEQGAEEPPRALFSFLVIDTDDGPPKSEAAA